MDFVSPFDPSGLWDSLTAASSDSTVFHTAAWARVLSETYGHRPFYLHFPKSNCGPTLLPMMEIRSRFTGIRAVSLPFSDFCGFLHLDPHSTPPDSPASTALRDALEDLTRRQRWKHLEIRGPLPWQQLPGSGAAPQSPTFLTHSLVLGSDFSALEKAFSPGHRRALRKPTGPELELRLSHDLSSVRDFYHLHSLTRRRHGLPPQPWRFFESIHRHLLAEGTHGFLSLAYWKKLPAAASLFLRLGDQALYKFGASDPLAWENRPNHHVMRHAIQELCRTGARSLHFGRTTPGQEGLIQFKSGWGASEAPLSYHQFRPSANSWHVIPPTDPQPGLANHLFSKLPLSFNRIAGRLLYPHLD